MVEVMILFLRGWNCLFHFFLQVSRSIGDAYLKKAEFNKEPLLAKFRLPEPFDSPILRAEPTVHVQRIHPQDRFLIFASDGLWEHLSNQEAVDIVNNSPRNVWFFYLTSFYSSYFSNLERGMQTWKWISWTWWFLFKITEWSWWFLL